MQLETIEVGLDIDGVHYLITLEVECDVESADRSVGIWEDILVPTDYCIVSVERYDGERITKPEYMLVRVAVNSYWNRHEDTIFEKVNSNV